MGNYLFNIGFWKKYIRGKFINQIELFNESIQNRLIPTFDAIEQESEERSEKEWDRLCASCYSPDIDPADLAEKAEEAGIEYYMTLSGIKQTLLNIAATALYHLFEQQIIFFLRREVLHPSLENDIELMKLSVFRDQLLKEGIDIYSFQSWVKIDELRIVSNSIKHAEGTSANQLRKIRPDMFKHPALRNQSEMELLDSAICPIYMPMAGDDIFVLQDDLSEYKNALVSFWNEFVLACSNYEDNMTT
jgi:hypothetical protein